MNYRWQVQIKAKYSDRATWLILYRDVFARNEFEARMKAEKQESKHKLCEWVKATEAIKMSELLPF